MPCPVCGGPGTVPLTRFQKMRVPILAGGRVKRRIRNVLLHWDEPCLWCMKGQCLKGNWKEEWL